jgi:hypothetical protein
MWRPVLDRSRLRSRPLPAALAVLAAGLLLVACDVEADLAGYFGSPAPTPSAAATATSLPTMPTLSPSATPTASPSSSPSPSASVTPSVSPDASPTSALPTRPPGLAEWATLRERARIVEYDRLLARPNDFIGEFVYFEGNVASVSDDGRGHFRARIRSGGRFMYWLYDAATYWGQPLVQGDRVRVVGDFIGLSSEAETGERVPEIEVLEILVKFT